MEQFIYTLFRWFEQAVAMDFGFLVRKYVPVSGRPTVYLHSISIK